MTDEGILFLGLDETVEETKARWEREWKSIPVEVYEKAREFERKEYRRYLKAQRLLSKVCARQNEY